jgi:glycoprotein endo-alpha-1,2-mannosidase
MLKPHVLPSTSFHLFYYPWWGNPAHNGGYSHWGDYSHDPANDDLACNYYPKLGVYSTRDPAVLTQHMAWINRAGVGTIVISWWGQGSPEDVTLPLVMDAAAVAGIKCCFITEPYPGRNATTVMADIRYLYDRYGNHPAFYRVSKPTKWGPSAAERGVFYVYDSYTITAGLASAVDAMRGTSYDAIFISNNSPITGTELVDVIHYDGFFTYNVKSEHGNNFQTMSSALHAGGSLWCPSVSAGYIDTRTERDGFVSRKSGQRLNMMMAEAYRTGADFITITSFNEWHEGTQIEPTQLKTIPSYTYRDFEGAYGKSGTEAETAYLDAVAYWTSPNPRRTV